MHVTMFYATALLLWQHVFICDSRLVAVPLALIKGKSLWCFGFFFPFLNQREEMKVCLKVPVESYKLNICCSVFQRKRCTSLIASNVCVYPYAVVGIGMGKGSKVEDTTWKAVSDPLIMFPQKFQGSTCCGYNSLARSPGELQEGVKHCGCLFSLQYFMGWLFCTGAQNCRVKGHRLFSGTAVGWFEILPAL